MFNELMDKVIKEFGFEAERTIAFCAECEEKERQIEEIWSRVEEALRNVNLIFEREEA